MTPSGPNSANTRATAHPWPVNSPSGGRLGTRHRPTPREVRWHRISRWASWRRNHPGRSHRLGRRCVRGHDRRSFLQICHVGCRRPNRTRRLPGHTLRPCHRASLCERFNRQIAPSIGACVMGAVASVPRCSDPGNPGRKCAHWRISAIGARWFDGRIPHVSCHHVDGLRQKQRRYRCGRRQQQ